MSADRPIAVVLLSGGLDSMVSAAIAREQGFIIHALSIDYGQRHVRELDCARDIASRLGAERHVVLPLDLRRFGGSALTDAGIAVPTSPSAGIPITYVPARNTIMLSLALAWAETLGSGDIFIGANAVDYSGYPDCRPEYLEAFEKMANLATKSAIEGRTMRIRAPIVHLTKAEIILRGIELGVDYSLTVSCYQADAHGSACGLCDSCRLRRQGFSSAGVADPTRYLLEP